MKGALIAVLLLALALTGCAREEKQPADTREWYDVSIGFWNLQDMEQSPEKDALWRYIEERFHIRIKPVSVGWANYHEQYQIMASTGMLPDIFADLIISSSNTANVAWLKNMLASGIVRALPDDLSAYPLLKEVIERADLAAFTDGKNCVIPRPSLTDINTTFSDAGMIARKDWMEALGYKQPETIDDFINMVAAFANDDPDANGADDTIGYNVNNRAAMGKWVMLAIAPQCNVYSWIMTDEGLYKPSYLTEEFEQVVRAYERLYDTGGLDPNFYGKKSNDAVTDFAQGRLGALEYKVSHSALLELKWQWELYHDDSQRFEDCVTLLNVPRAPDGKYYSNTSAYFWSETLISSAVDDLKLKRILELFDYLLSDEGYALTRRGIEGVDYALDANGEYNCLLKLDQGQTLSLYLRQKYPSLSLFTSLASWGGTRGDFEVNAFNSLQYGEFITRSVHEALSWAEKHTIFVSRPYTFMLMPREQTDIFSTAPQDELARAIIGEGDAVELWRESLNRYYEMGLMDYIIRQNQRAREMGIHEIG